MKRNKIFLVTLFMIFNLFVFNTSLAYGASDTIVSLQIDNPVMEVNGIETEIDAGEGTTPVVIDGRTLVPIRAIIESFDGTVGWDGNTRTATLELGDDTIALVIDSTVAYLNGGTHTLDVAPTIINGRTMLPIRFIAEGFNLGVAWDNNTRTVTIISQVYDSLPFDIPAYYGSPYVEVNNNIPLFNDYEIITGSFEYYGELDYIGRCGVSMASIAEDIMPQEERGSISSVTPTGWHSVTYDNVEGGYLYNRCHMIGFQLTGENANEQNLITGTRYMNVDGMLPFENMVADYIEATGNHVMYRATPVFEGENLVASGVLLEAYSIEDNGAGIAFCVYCYNVQPGVDINYADGTSSGGWDGSGYSEEVTGDGSSYFVINTNSGKFHYPSCSSAQRISDENRATSDASAQELISQGYSPCGNCDPQ